MELPRHARALIDAASADTPVIVLHGARQVGKSTLARAVAAERGAPYLTLDDPAVRQGLVEDPVGVLQRHDAPVVIDEVQRAPDVPLAVKLLVDQQRRPGHFLLTGSTRFMAIPRLGDSLAGRVEIVDLHPLSQGELARRAAPEDFLAVAFEGADAALGLPPSKRSRRDYLLAAVAGGYPAAWQREPDRRRVWFRDYLRTVIDRHVLELADVERLDRLPVLLSAVAARSGSLHNTTAVANATALDPRTVDRYLQLLRDVFLITSLPAWSRNLTRRLAKSPKLHLVDSGLGAALLGIVPDVEPAQRDGQLLESFVHAELQRQLTWSRSHARLFHYRSAKGQEVDLIAERPDGRIVAIEVKAGTTLSGDDTRNLTALRDELGRDFALGVVLSSAPQPISRGDRLVSLPIDALWAPL